MSDSFKNNETTTQNKILKNVKNLLKLRDNLLLIKLLTLNLKFNKLNKLNYVTSSNRIVLNEINVFNLQLINLLNSQNSIIDDFSKNELILYIENINFDLIIYLNIKTSFDSTE